MKRAAVFAAALACACGSQQKPPNLPVIVSFTVDNSNPLEADPITFSFAVQNATKVSLFPQPAAPVTSPYTLVPVGTGSYVLRAENGDGHVDRALSIVVQKAPPVRVTLFNASPGQSQAGQNVSLTWAVQNAVRLEFSDGSGAPAKDVTQLGSMVVQPQATTLYTLTAYAKQGRTPATHSAFTAARVLKPSQVASFTAAPLSIVQGAASTLSWSGDALSWAIKDDAGAITPLGPRRTLEVRPARTTVYTLLATGPSGTTAAGPVTISVDPKASSALASTSAAAARPLRLDISCTGQTCLASLFATAAISLRGVALDLPVDATKISASGLTLDPQVFASGSSTGQVALGSGPLQNTLVLGAALTGSGTDVASDVGLSAGAHLLDFTLTLQSAGGVGPIFDGSGARSWLQSAQGRSADAIAVGTLSAVAPSQ